MWLDRILINIIRFKLFTRQKLRADRWPSGDCCPKSHAISIHRETCSIRPVWQNSCRRVQFFEKGIKKSRSGIMRFSKSNEAGRIPSKSMCPPVRNWWHPTLSHCQGNLKLWMHFFWKHFWFQNNDFLLELWIGYLLEQGGPGLGYRGDDNICCPHVGNSKRLKQIKIHQHIF